MSSRREKIQKFKDAYKAVYYMVNDTVIDIVAATVIATFTKCDPIWLLVVGGSGAGKSELINCFNKVDFVHPVSELTENTLLSGMNTGGNEPSLLTTIGARGCISMKDYTSILSMRREKRDVILGQLREVYDGAYEKKTGNGKNPSWTGKVHFIGGVTEAVYDESGESASMGRRNIHYVMPEQDRMITARTARNNRRGTDMADKREHLQNMAKEMVEGIIEEMPAILPPLSYDFSERLLVVSNFATKIRTPPIRNFRRELTLATSEEMPMRMSEQLHAIAETLQFMYDDELPEELQQAVIKIAFDSVPKPKRICLRLLAQYSTCTTKGIAIKLKYPTETAKEWLQDLNILDVISRVAGGGVGTVDRWRIKNSFRDIMIEYDGIVRKIEDLILDDDDAIEPYEEEVDPIVALEQRKMQHAERIFGEDIDKAHVAEQAEVANRLFDKM